jgi:hypothetical protein
MKEIIDRIEALPAELKPITIQVKKYLENNSNIDEAVLNVLHRPWVAPLNWGLMLYKGADPKWFLEFEKRTQKTVPEFYQNFLKHINGGFIYGMSMYGLTPSIYDTGVLKRTVLQCHDLTTANISWIRDDVDPKLFHFAGRSYSRQENIGYFFDDDKILAIRKNCEILNKWTNFGDMLFDEIETVEKMMLEKIPKNIRLKVN